MRKLAPMFVMTTIALASSSAFANGNTSTVPVTGATLSTNKSETSNAAPNTNPGSISGNGNAAVTTTAPTNGAALAMTPEEKAAKRAAMTPEEKAAKKARKAAKVDKTAKLGTNGVSEPDKEMAKTSKGGDSASK